MFKSVFSCAFDVLFGLRKDLMRMFIVWRKATRCTMVKLNSFGEMAWDGVCEIESVGMRVMIVTFPHAKVMRNEKKEKQRTMADNVEHATKKMRRKLIDNLRRSKVQKMITTLREDYTNDWAYYRLPCFNIMLQYNKMLHFFLQMHFFYYSFLISALSKNNNDRMSSYVLYICCWKHLSRVDHRCETRRKQKTVNRTR